jgi:hypothetical protein
VREPPAKYWGELARQHGALSKQGRINWRRLCMKLHGSTAEDAERDPRLRGPGVALRLIQDVSTIMVLRQCSAEKACAILAQGADDIRDDLRTEDGTRVVFPRQDKAWKGRRHKALKAYYFDQRRRLRKK